MTRRRIPLGDVWGLVSELTRLTSANEMRWKRSSATGTTYFGTFPAGHPAAAWTNRLTGHDLFVHRNGACCLIASGEAVRPLYDAVRLQTTPETPDWVLDFMREVLGVPS